MTPSSILDRIAYGAAVLFLPAAAGVLGGELGPASGEPHIWDKTVHFTAYFIVSWLAVTALKSRATALWAMLGLIVMGGALEIVQGLIGRDCSIYDEIANTLGVLAGGLVAWIVVKLVARAVRA
jgi:VanZ family protein